MDCAFPISIAGSRSRNHVMQTVNVDLNFINGECNILERYALLWLGLYISKKYMNCFIVLLA